VPATGIVGTGSDGSSPPYRMTPVSVTGTTIMRSEIMPLSGIKAFALRVQRPPTPQTLF
jgi:hypothetical protein